MDAYRRTYGGKKNHCHLKPSRAMIGPKSAADPPFRRNLFIFYIFYFLPVKDGMVTMSCRLTAEMEDTISSAYQTVSQASSFPAFVTR